MHNYTLEWDTKKLTNSWQEKNIKYTQLNIYSIFTYVVTRSAREQPKCTRNVFVQERKQELNLTLRGIQLKHNMQADINFVPK